MYNNFERLCRKYGVEMGGQDIEIHNVPKFNDLDNHIRLLDAAQSGTSKIIGVRLDSVCDPDFS